MERQLLAQARSLVVEVEDLNQDEKSFQEALDWLAEQPTESWD